MKFAIIAAGEGSRLALEGIGIPKPLVKINGIPLIERAIQIFDICEASEIIIIINHSSKELKERLIELSKYYPIKLLIEDTKGSMESFSKLAPYLKDDKFCLTTVDAIYNEVEFAAYIANFVAEKNESDALMAVTNYIDDEKPLYISADEKMNITGYYDKEEPGADFISGGIYCMTPKCIDILNKCVKEGKLRMREFQRELVNNGLKIKAHLFNKIIDVDHATDIKKAEIFLRMGDPIIGISRSTKFSPNRESADFNIFNKVKKELENRGHYVITYSEERYINQPIIVETIFSMGREKITVESLELIQEKVGARIINSPKAVKNNSDRYLLYKYLNKKNIGSPKSVLIDTSIPEEQQAHIEYPCWIKRNDSHTEQKEDVSFVTSPKQLEIILSSFKKRGINKAIACEHISGDLVKFYGVGTHRFFTWYYPEKESSKFGQESINGKNQGISFDEKVLRKQCEQAAIEMQLDIYGGDAIVTSDNQIYIIDLNDWPSFGKCQNEAAPAIADLILNQ